jgi:hypothetical protein
MRDGGMRWFGGSLFPGRRRGFLCDGEGELQELIQSGGSAVRKWAGRSLQRAVGRGQGVASLCFQASARPEGEPCLGAMFERALGNLSRSVEARPG